MKYVGLEEFMKLPKGTVFMIEEYPTGGPLYGFERPIYIKDGNCLPDDWFQRDLISLGYSGELHTKVEAAIEGKDAKIIEPVPGRYGFNPTEARIKFWVLTEDDHELLINVLTAALHLTIRHSE